MEPKDKQPRVLKAVQDRYKAMHLPPYVVGLGVVVVIVLAAVIVHHLPTKTNRSQTLVNKISHLQNTTQCSDGLKQIQPMDKALTSSNQYSNAAKEKGLNYLMNCSVVAGNTKQALVYANQLYQLYVKEGNAQKEAYLSGMINYIKQIGQ